jgi:hypothetical protein
MRDFIDRVEHWMEDPNTLVEMGKAFLVFGTLLLILIAIIMTPVIYIGTHEPAFTLQKSDWSCTASHTEYRPVLVGKVLVPQRIEVCDNYTRTR